MTKLSVNINKIATLRNARGGAVPDLIEAARNCERFGAEGITVHPRPDERHIRYNDVKELAKVVSSEFNIEGYPSEDFINLVLANPPAQVTLVPDPPGVLTSNAGWNAIEQLEFLKPIVATFKNAGIRVSVFMDCDKDQIRAIAKSGADRIELYTEAYARNYLSNPEAAVAPYREAAKLAHNLGLGINAGHDLDRENLRYFVRELPHLLEVSIGHALISEALYLGLENTIQGYLREIEMAQ
ncbi:MAG: pyridoxine 5'-phosphate synthase [Croceimicrobium sp.]